MVNHQQDTSWGYVVVRRGRGIPSRAFIASHLHPERGDAERERSIEQRVADIRYPGSFEYLVGKIVGADD